MILYHDIPEAHHMKLPLQLASELEGIELQCSVNLTSKMLIEVELLPCNSFCVWQNCVMQGNLYKYLCKSFQFLDKLFIYKHKFENLAITLEANMKVILWRMSY